MAQDISGLSTRLKEIEQEYDDYNNMLSQTSGDRVNWKQLKESVTDEQRFEETFDQYLTPRIEAYERLNDLRRQYNSVCNLFLGSLIEGNRDRKGALERTGDYGLSGLAKLMSKARCVVSTGRTKKGLYTEVIKEGESTLEKDSEREREDEDKLKKFETFVEEHNDKIPEYLMQKVGRFIALHKEYILLSQGYTDTKKGLLSSAQEEINMLYPDEKGPTES